MRLGARRRINIRSNRAGKGRLSLCLVFLCLLALIFFGAMYFLQIARPIMIHLAENQAEIIAEQAVASAVSELFQDVHYDEFITISRLEDGTVSSLQANLGGVNRLRAAATTAIQEALSATAETRFSIPLGALTGYELLAGTGPDVSVQLMPYGRTSVNFKSSFSEAGINQTRLEIYAEAKTTVGILLPTARISREISTNLPVIQTLIIGEVPDNYVSIDRMGEQYEDDVLDLIG